MTEWWRRPQRIVQTNLRLIDASLDPDRVARQARDFGATALLFNVGGIYAWYPTDLELQAGNPFLTRDLVGDMIDACRRSGLRFIGRYDLSKGTEIAFRARPDWFCRRHNGQPMEYEGTYQACINGGWYQEQAIRVIEETLGRYEIDALFCNMFGYVKADYSHRANGLCYCENCRTGFSAFSGGDELPAQADPTDPVYRRYLQFQDATTEALSRKIYVTVKRVRPTTGIANLLGGADFMRTEANHSIVRSQPEWAYQSGEQARAARSIGGGAPYSASVVHFIDFPWRHAAESAACQGLRLAQQLANGGSPHYYFLGTFDQEDEKPLDLVKWFFAFHARHEAIYDGLVSGAKIALYHSQKTERYGLREEVRDVHKELGHAFRGAFRALLELGLAFDTVSDRRAEDPRFGDMLAHYDIIVLPDVACLADAEAAALDRFVEAGGTLLLTGRPGIGDAVGEPRPRPALKCLPTEISPTVRSEMRGAYLTGTDALGFEKTRLIALDNDYFEASLRPGTTTELRLLPPQRFGPPELCYADEEPTDWPGLASIAYGTGRTIWLPWKPDTLYYLYGIAEHRHLIAELVRSASLPPVKLSRTTRLELTLQLSPDGSGGLVHVVNYSGQNNNVYEEPVPHHGLRLGIQRAAGDAAKTLVAGDSLLLGAPDADGYRWVDLPPIGYFEAVRFERSPSTPSRAVLT